jgi:hypothetical protein
MLREMNVHRQIACAVIVGGSGGARCAFADDAEGGAGRVPAGVDGGAVGGGGGGGGGVFVEGGDAEVAVYVLVEEGGDGFDGEVVDGDFLGSWEMGFVVGAIGAGEGGWCSCCVGASVEVEVRVVPVIEGVVDVGFEVGHGATVGAHELGVCFVVVEHGADAFEVPDVRAWRDEEGLAGL